MRARSADAVRREKRRVTVRQSRGGRPPPTPLPLLDLLPLFPKEPR